MVHYTIKAVNLSKKFVKIEKKSNKKEFFAVEDISFNIEQGEVVGVLGANGAGKTTLLRMLGNLMKPTSGTILVEDSKKNKLEKDIDIKRNIGYLSCNTKLYHRLTVREMLRVFADIYGLEKQETQKRIDDIIDILDMKNFIDNRIEKLSTGQTQRANISRCLIHKPEIYIFDEPTLGLDIISSQSIIEFMKKEKLNGKTIIYSTHYMEEAQFLCDRIIMLHKGRIIEEGKPNELMKKYMTDNLRDTFYKILEKQEVKSDE